MVLMKHEPLITATIICITRMANLWTKNSTKARFFLSVKTGLVIYTFNE